HSTKIRTVSPSAESTSTRLPTKPQPVFLPWVPGSSPQFIWGSSDFLQGGHHPPLHRSLLPAGVGTLIPPLQVPGLLRGQALEVGQNRPVHRHKHPVYRGVCFVLQGL